MNFTLEYADDEELDRKLIVVLEARGYSAVKGLIPWERSRWVGRRLGIKPGMMCKLLKQFKGEFPARRADSGRLLELQVTPALEAYLKQKRLP